MIFVAFLSEKPCSNAMDGVDQHQSGSLTSFSTGELGSTEAVQNNVWTKTVTTRRNYGPGFCCHRGNRML